MVQIDLQLFGGRGSGSGGTGSGGGRGGLSGNGERLIPDSDGNNIDLGDAVLRYGGEDKALSGAARAAVTATERKRLTAKVEHASAYDANGNRVGAERRGGKGSVSVTRQMVNAPVLTHNHPREAGVLGGTFSVADIRNWANNGMVTHRASAKEGTYSISKGPNFDAAGAMAHARKVERDAISAHRDRTRQLAKDRVEGRITWDEYSRAFDQSFNRALVDMHNGYAAGASQYGYSYTLERRT